MLLAKSTGLPGGRLRDITSPGCIQYVRRSSRSQLTIRTSPTTSLQDTVGEVVMGRQGTFISAEAAYVLRAVRPCKLCRECFYLVIVQRPAQRTSPTVSVRADPGGGAGAAHLRLAHRLRALRGGPGPARPGGRPGAPANRRPPPPGPDCLPDRPTARRRGAGGGRTPRRRCG